MSKVLDISDLDTYLLSLVSTDVKDVFRDASIGVQRLLRFNNNYKNGANANDNDDDADVDDDIDAGAKRSTTKFMKRLQILCRRCIAVSTKTETDLSWLLEFVTILMTQGTTPGAQLLGFRSTSRAESRTTGSRHPPPQQKNENSTRRRRRRMVVVYAFLRVVLPKLYAHIKVRGLDYATTSNIDDDDNGNDNNNTQTTIPSPLTMRLQQHPQQQQQQQYHAAIDDDDDDDDEVEKEQQHQLSLKRKQMIVRTVFQFIDTTIPIVRLTLLLSCWMKNATNSNNNNHGPIGNNTNINNSTNTGGNLAMYVAGLSYKYDNQNNDIIAGNNSSTTTTMTTTETKHDRTIATPTTEETGTSSSPAAAAVSKSTPASASVSLFVLFAYQRWYYRELYELVWERIGRNVLIGCQEMHTLVLVPFWNQNHKHRIRWKKWNRKWEQLYKTIWKFGVVPSLSLFRQRHQPQPPQQPQQQFLSSNDDNNNAPPIVINKKNKKSGGSGGGYCCPICGTDDIGIPYQLIVNKDDCDCYYNNASLNNNNNNITTTATNCDCNCVAIICCYTCLWKYTVDNHNASTTLDSANSGFTRSNGIGNVDDADVNSIIITIPCPVCYQDITLDNTNIQRCAI